MMLIHSQTTKHNSLFVEKRTLPWQEDLNHPVLKGKKMFLLADEAEVADFKFLNIIIGDLDNPSFAYLGQFKALDPNANSHVVTQSIDDVIFDL